MISRHRHIWKIESRETLPSPWEQANERHHVNKLKVDETFFRSPVIVTYKCAACGSQKVERV